MSAPEQKYYFFVDLGCEENLKDDLVYYAAGIILSDDRVNGEPSVSGKDFCVQYICPRGTTPREWRAVDEIRLIETSEFNYEVLKYQIEKLENQK